MNPDKPDNIKKYIKKEKPLSEQERKIKQRQEEIKKIEEQNFLFYNGDKMPDPKSLL